MRDLTEIEAPPFGDRKKAEGFLALLRAIGLANAQIDPEGNVVADSPEIQLISEHS
jgi:tripeptide aminopeptidase